MITLKDIADYFVSAGLGTGLAPTGNVYYGGIDAQKNEIIGLYNRDTAENDLMVGGIDYTSTEQKRFTVLVHWNKDMEASEQKAIDIYNHFRTNQTPVIGGYQVYNVDCTSGQPIDVSQHEKNNVHELVLDFLLDYQRI